MSGRVLRAVDVRDASRSRSFDLDERVQADVVVLWCFIADVHRRQKHGLNPAFSGYMVRPRNRSVAAHEMGQVLVERELHAALRRDLGDLLQHRAP